MKRLIIALLFVTHVLYLQSQDQNIQQMVDNVSGTTIWQYIDELGLIFTQVVINDKLIDFERFLIVFHPIENPLNFIVPLQCGQG